MKTGLNPTTVKVALKIAGIVLAVATAVVAEWQAGAITNGYQLATALFQAVSGQLENVAP